MAEGNTKGARTMTRLIDADLYKEDMTNEYPEYYEDVLDAQPTIDAEPHWIPCSERLPEKDGYYLTTTCYRQVYCDFWNEDHFDRTEAVIAWMPLPEPYEVEE